MFCDSRNDPKETRPNVNVCPVCMAHPGTLPVVNKEAVRHVVRLGRAVGGTVASYTEFDRKNYFYPDIPKGYQISQFAYPLIRGGELSGVALTRVHLEEDTASSQHDAGEGTLVDFNRAGVPLMELVTEPVIHDAQTAGKFARELQLLLRYLGASEANMEEGQMRIEANVSVAEEGKLATAYVEIKNISSFRSVERAINFEIARQQKILEDGGSIVKETRGWDDAKGVTFSQRKKESSHDYRYFPDPDLPKLSLSVLPELSDDALAATMPELPWARRDRYLAAGLKAEDADMFVRTPQFGDFFDRASVGGEAALVANYLASDVAGAVQAGLVSDAWLSVPENPARFSKLMAMTAGRQVSSRGAKEILAIMFSDTREPHEIAESEGLYQQSDAGALEKIAQTVIEANAPVVADYLGGKDAAMQFLVGQGMKASKGSADPGALRDVFSRLLTRP